MKKIFTLFAALTMVMSMSAATKTIYFKTQQWWHKDDAASAAYYWEPSAAPTWPGIRMTKVDGVADMWSVDVDTDKYKNIIFTRVNGSGNVEDWGAKTQDLVIPTDDKNLFTLSTTEVWGGSGASGTWSVYAPDAPKTYKDITITVVANATPKIHYWEGGDKVTGSEWETKPDMVATGEENTYSYTIKDVDEATGVKYLIVVGEVQSADQQAFENVTANFKDLLPQVVVMGVTGWTGDKMTVADDYLSASVTLNLKAATDYELKLTVNGQWYGSNAITITKDNNSASFAENGEGNGKLTTDLAGDYVLTYTYATKTLVVTYPVPTPTYTVTVSAENGSVEGLENEGVYEEGASVTLTATAADGYEFVNWTVAGEEVSTENPYTFVVSADVAVVANFVAVDYKDITFTVGKSGFTGVPQIKWWGAKGLEDAAEPVEMTAGQYSRYSYTFSNIDAITGVSFYIVLDGVQSKTITLHETPNTYSQFYTILQEVFVTLDGEIEGVQLEGHPKAGYSSDYTKVNGVVQLPANTTKAFKLTVDGKDKGGNTIALTKDNLTANFTEDGEGNATIATELAGGYLFTYDYITKDVTVVYPFVGTMDLGQMTPSYDDESVTLEDDNYNEVTIYNVVEGEHTYGENFDIEASVKHNGEWYTLRGKGSWTLADGVMTLVATNLVDKNNTVNYTITATALAPQEYTIVCNGTYDEEVTEYYSSIKYIGTTNDTTVTIEIASYGGEPNVLGDINGTYFTIAEYVVEEGEDGVKVLTATATDAAGNTYHITITATKLVYPSVNIYGATATLNEEEGTLTLSAEYKGKTVISEIWGYEGAGEYEWVGLVPTDYSFEWGADIATVTEDGDQYTITGVFMDYTTEEKYEVMITTAKNPATALENVTSTVAPMKAIVNGQLVIVKDGVQYNAQGAVVK